MKKHILIFILLLSIFFCGNAQNAYYDALYLSSNYKLKATTIDNTTFYEIQVAKKDRDKIINKFHSSLISKTSDSLIVEDAYDEIYKTFEDNPFFTFPQHAKADDDEKTTGTSPLSFASISGLDVTTIAIGMSGFLKERTKEELTIAFFHRFKDFLIKYPESEALFPKTSDFIEHMLANEYSVWLEILRNKFLEDIQNLPFRIDNVLELPKYKYIVNQLPELLVCLKIIETIQDASKDMKNAKHSAEIIHDIVEIEAWSKIKNPDSKNLHASFQTMDLISQSLQFIDDSIILKMNADTSDLTYQDDSHLIRRRENSGQFEYDTLKSWSKNSIAWVSNQHLRVLLEDTTAFRIYLGLIYQKAITNSTIFYPSEVSVYLKKDKKLKKGDIICKNSNILIDNNYKIEKEDRTIDNNETIKKGSFLIYKKPSQNLTEILSKYSDNILGMRDLIESFNAVTTELNNVQDSLLYKKKNSIKLKSDDYKQYLSASFNTINFGFDITEYIDGINIIKLKYYRTISKELSNSINNIYDENYTEAIINASNIFETIVKIVKDNELINTESTELNYKTTKQKLSKDLQIDNKEAKEILKDYNYTKNSQNHVKTIKSFNNFTQRLMYYGNFMARIAQADSSEEVTQIIKSTALPAGSSSLKKYNWNNIAINAYVGSIMEFESSNNEELAFELYAPIGVVWTPLALKRAGAFSVFAGVIDLGAIVNSQLNQTDTVYANVNGTNDTLATSNKIHLGNILAPSINFAYGFGGNIPLTLSAGIQYAPSLSKLTSTDIILRESYWRFNLALTVDLPLYNIYSGRRKK